MPTGLCNLTDVQPVAAINSSWSLCLTPEAGKAGVLLSLLPKCCSYKPIVTTGTSINWYDSCNVSEPFMKTRGVPFFVRRDTCQSSEANILPESWMYYQSSLTSMCTAHPEGITVYMLLYQIEV